MELILFICANLVVILTSFIIASKIKLQAVSDKVLALFIFVISQIILTQMVAGVLLRQLNPYMLIGLNSIILVVVILISNKFDVGKQSKKIALHFRYTMKKVLTSPVLLIISILFFIQTAYIIYIGYNFPPYGWDEIWYHLTTIASWVQAGHIGQLRDPSIWSIPQLAQNMTQQQISYHMSVMGMWHNVYPMNAELLSMWSMILLDKDTLVDLMQLPFSVMGIVSVYSIARKLKLPRSLATLSGLMFFFTPILIIQSRTSYVDIAYNVLVLICINFFIGFVKDKKNVFSYLCAASAGILLGIKTSGVMFVVFFVLGMFYSYYKKNAIQFVLKKVAIISTIIFVLGGYWYVRNVYYYGNPIYPYTISIGNIIIFRGLGSVDSLIMNHNLPTEYFNLNYIQRLLYSWVEKEGYYSVDMRSAGFGPVWFVLGLPSIVLMVALAIYKKNKRVFETSLIFLVLFILHPSNWWTRYTIFFVGLGCIAISMILKNSAKLTRFSISVCIVALIIYTIVVTSSYLLPNNITEVMSIPRQNRTIGATRYSDYQWVDRLNNSIIGYAPMTFTYPLFSGDFRNKVYLVDGNTKEEWFENMDKMKIDYITFLKNYLSYQQWIDERREMFELIYQGSTICVYKVKR